MKREELGGRVRCVLNRPVLLQVEFAFSQDRAQMALIKVTT